MSEATFFSRVQAMTAIVASDDPVAVKWERVRSLLDDVDVEREFWRVIATPDWLPLLRAHSQFDHPPQAIKLSGGALRYTVWPPSKFLARVASAAPEEVAQIFAAIDTDNAAVWDDALDAARSMPPDVAATLVPALSRAIESNALAIGFDEAANLCVDLASHGQPDSAMALAEPLFAPQFTRAGDLERSARSYWYKTGISKVLPPLVAVRANKLLPKLCDWLRRAVEAREYVDQETGADYSYSWRPAIEEHEQNSNYDFAGELVGYVRDTFERAIAGSFVEPESAIALLGKENYVVFRRLRIHIINVFADRMRALARRTMMDRTLFEDFQQKHEYAMLLERRFAFLDAEERQAWFNWVDAGPDMSDFDEAFTSNTGKSPTDTDRRRRIRYWQFNRLHWVRNYLTGRWESFYRDMLAEHGEPTLADLSIRVTSGFVAVKSPYSVADLEPLPFPDAVRRVAEWKPEKGTARREGSDGLSATFREYVAKHADVFSAQSSTMQSQPPLFVRIFIEQMTEAAKQAKEIHVAAILALCQWVLDQPAAGIPQSESTQGSDDRSAREWQHARDAVSDFIEAVCTAAVGDAPRYPAPGIRDRIVPLLQRLTKDSATSYIVHEADEDPRCFDYFPLGLNSPRGKAVGAMLECARWLAKHSARTSSAQDSVPRGFDAMPDLRRLLEWQLVPDHASFEAYAIIGSRVGLLYWLDRAWLAAQAGRLFDLSQIETNKGTAFAWAAWNAFLVWVQPHIEFYRLLEPQFAYAVAQASTVQVMRNMRAEPMRRLGEHLMILYGRGQLSLGDADSLIRRLLSDAAPELRLHAISFVGTTLRGDVKLPADVINRFMDLWNWYWPNGGRRDVEFDKERVLFGSWFAGGQFPNAWSLEQLEKVVRIAGILEPDDLIVERLADIATTDVGKAATILSLMVRADKEGWRIRQWREHAKRILSLAMSAGGAVRAEAIQSIDYLGRRGFMEFGDLLAA